MGTGARNWPWWLLYAVVGIVAVAVRLTLMLRGGGLLGVGAYDDGVYYAAADAFIHGRVPYADFLFIQPPGVILVTAPFAWIGSLAGDPTGFVAARVAFMLVGGINAALVAAILRRFGFAASAIGGFAYALSFVAAYGERSVLLEPFGTLGILIALLVLSRRRLRSSTWWLVGAGFALGAATGFKIWYIVPAVIIIVWSWRGWWRMLLGALVGACAVYLPFFLAAPTTMLHEVVLDQLGRADSGVSLGERLHVILGDYGVPHALAQTGFDTTQVTVILAAVLGVASVVALTMRGARLYVVLMAADIALLLASPSFYLHYAALTSPMIALVLGAGVGRLISMIRLRAVEAVLVGVVVVALAVGNYHAVTKGAGVDKGSPELTAAVAAVQGCVMADDPSMLIITNRLTRDLRAGCALWPDVTGYTYSSAQELRANGTAVPRADNATWQAMIHGYLTSGTAAILSRAGTGLSAETHRAITSKGTLLLRVPHTLMVIRTGTRNG